MRRYLLAIPFLFACTKKEAPPADSAAAAVAPAALTEAEVAGTWSGTAMAEGSDSVFSHWTIMCGAGACRLTSTENPKDTIASTYVLAADSSAFTSSPMPEPSMKGAMVVDHYVARFSGNQVTGHGWMTLADKPDSVVMRYRFTGTKNP